MCGVGDGMIDSADAKKGLTGDFIVCPHCSRHITGLQISERGTIPKELLEDFRRNMCEFFGVDDDSEDEGKTELPILNKCKRCGSMPEYSYFIQSTGKKIHLVMCSNKKCYTGSEGKCAEEAFKRWNEND